MELRQQVGDEVVAAFEVEPPPGLARRPDFQPLDALVEPGGMIVAGVRYGRAEVDAARRLLRELGQPERALRSVLEFVRRERIGAGGGAPSPLPLPRWRAAAGAAVPAHRRVEAKRAALDRLARRWAELRRAIDPGYTLAAGPGAGQSGAWASTARADAGEAQLDDGLAFACAQSSRSWSRATRRMPSACASPSSVAAIDGRLGAATGSG